MSQIDAQRIIAEKLSYYTRKDSADEWMMEAKEILSLIHPISEQPVGCIDEGCLHYGKAIKCEPKEGGCIATIPEHPISAAPLKTPTIPEGRNGESMGYEGSDNTAARTEQPDDYPQVALKRIPDEEFDDLAKDEIYGIPAYYTLRNDQCFVWPLPSNLPKRESIEVDQSKAVKIMLSACEGLDDLEDCMVAAFSALDNNYRIEGDQS